ncbi:uncharacterized protein I303_107055 [Kwoniella dejecticola CBS 10117]|uniref:Uncharacterized protein n=1 Tax=Kwoniella dejecticola CBS 10117 TaxID=1296121 RepID=A0A1A5ZYL9_9TREE|nr:uncharacterized protein I303_06456 [Kwoniella dejecticola CBS 10117]OBR82899.1 hypothetical protein I303_06456 [Kwoniella dejecticola CBS 10117]
MSNSNSEGQQILDGPESLVSLNTATGEEDVSKTHSSHPSHVFEIDDRFQPGMNKSTGTWHIKKLERQPKDLQHWKDSTLPLVWRYRIKDFSGVTKTSDGRTVTKLR